MAVFTDKREIEAFTASHALYLALGYFDGFHLGHQGIVEQTMRLSAEGAGEGGVLLLEPHPKNILEKDKKLRILNTLEEKIHLIRAFGSPHVFILPFDRELARLSPEAFVQEYLVGLFHSKTAVCGYNYHFGYQGRGNSETLERLSSVYGFSCHILPRITAREFEPVSSSVIRSLIEEGAMFDAYSRLGHAHVFSGSVVGGHQIGGKLGFPTANIAIEQGLLWPAYGVYGGFVKDEKGRVFQGIINVGIRPTIHSGSQPSFEAYLLGFHGDLYGSRMWAILTDRLRPEKAFDGLEALKEQIARDVEDAKSLLAKWEDKLIDESQTPESLFTCFIRDFSL